MPSPSVKIFEVGPRDGLQNEQTPISTADKIHLIDLLSVSGLTAIEATAFVSPKWVPQMSDAADVMAGINRLHGIRYTALTPNLAGFDRAMDAGVDEIAVFAAASETFSQKNINCSVEESLLRFLPVLTAATEGPVPVRGYVSCVAGCPYEGDIEPMAVARVVENLLRMGCYEVSLGDTIGCGTPESIEAMLDAVLSVASPHQLAGHFHDTGGRALENIQVSLARDIRTFDSAVAGLGGCPYAPGAKGNVATGSVIRMLNDLGETTGIDLDLLASAEEFAASLRSPGQRHGGSDA